MILSVAEGGTLALTQQLTHFNALGSVTPNTPPFNPFAAHNVATQHLPQVLSSQKEFKQHISTNLTISGRYGIIMTHSVRRI